jgi:class 3 adenylate cyclase
MTPPVPPATPASHERCILFADIAGSTRLYEKLGDAEARHAVERCLKRVRLAVEGCHGRVVKTIGDAILAAFNNVETCLQAACQMQQRMADLPRVGGIALEIRVGFHHGPVLEENGDVFGDAVNLAARMADIAKAGQIIASASSIAGLSPLARQATRELAAVPVKGKGELVRVCEVIWHDEGNLTLMQTVPPPTTLPPRAELRLRHGGNEIALAVGWDVVLLGRDKGGDVVIVDPMASRQHARIERRGDKIVLIEQSTNGSWITLAGENERQLRREELVLMSNGRLSFGHPWHAGGEVIEFFIV